jgi:DNA gyrase subunit A
MYDSGVTSDKPYRKSARITGEVMGRYHPHGDSAVYDAMVRLAQDFSTRYPLVDGQGNFGSVDGDMAAAQRYTEARMSKIAQEMLKDIDKDTVEFVPNYDNELEEPTVLPARIPNLLINGSSGIAVGMATNIPPHNLGEVIDGVTALINQPQITVNELMNYIKGPDYPTGGTIMGMSGIRQAYETGRGSIVTRAVSEIEGMSGGKSRILITEIPYMVNKARLIEKIAELVRDKKIEGISDLRDESDRNGMRIVIELKKDINPQMILSHLYKHTQLQESFGVILLALVEGEPQVLNLRQMLYYYLEHQKDVVTRRTRYELRKAEERLHIVEGLRIAIDHIDEIIRIIRASRDYSDFEKTAMERFGLSNRQTQAIWDMRLGRLSALESEKLAEEYKQLIEKIVSLRGILAEERLILKLIKDELQDIKTRYADGRKSKINPEDDTISMEDLIPDDEVVITITHGGYIKRQPITDYRSQKRGGRGVSAITTKEEDFVEHLFTTTNHHFLLFFTNQGKVYRTKVYDVPEASRQAKGTAIVNLLYITGNDIITAVIPVKRFDEGQYLLTVTRNGIMKKTSLTEYNTSRKDGIIALTLDEEDELIGVQLTTGEDEILLATHHGMVIRVSETDVRSMGRTARGVKGIHLGLEDQVVGVENLKAGEDLLVMTEKGFSKRTRLIEFRSQIRGGKGVMGIRITQKNGMVAGVMAVSPGDEIMIITLDGIMIRTHVDDISRLGRATQGVMAMRLGDKDKVVAIARIISREDLEDD